LRHSESLFSKVIRLHHHEKYCARLFPKGIKPTGQSQTSNAFLHANQFVWSIKIVFSIFFNIAAAAPAPTPLIAPYQNVPRVSFTVNL
jgi:hypothetical protein